MADSIDEFTALVGDANARAEMHAALIDLVEWTTARFIEGAHPAALAVALDIVAKMVDGSSKESVELWRIARERKALETGRISDPSATQH